jgi:YD repeat-containing protein
VPGCGTAWQASGHWPARRSTDWDLSAKVEPGSDTVLVRLAGRAPSAFRPNPNGSYATSDGRPELLAGVAGSGFELVMQGGTKYAFNSSGCLTTVSDGLNHDLGLTYDGSGRLSVVRNMVNNRTLTYTWWGTTPDHIKSVKTDQVTDPVTSTTGAPEVTYAYAGSTLVMACGPRAATERSQYGYVTVGAGLVRLKTITLPKGNQFVKLGYRPEGSVASQEVGVGLAGPAVR